MSLHNDKTCLDMSKLSRHTFGMPMVLSMAPMPLLGHNHQNAVNMTFLVMWCHWYQHSCHVMPILFHKVKKTETSCDMTLLVTWWLLVPMPTSGDTDVILNSTIFFVSLRWLKWGSTWLFCHVMPVLASHDTDGIVNGMIAFVSLWQSKWIATQTFLILWCHWHQH